MTEEEIKRILELTDKYYKYVCIFKDEEEKIWFSIKHNYIFKQLLDAKIKKIPVKDGSYRMAYVKGINIDGRENPPYMLKRLGLSIAVFRRKNNKWEFDYITYPYKINEIFN